MDIAVLLFLTSGLFLGWSLGANDAANVFGTAVGTRMVRFTTAALICSIFVILGAVISGAGAAHTLGKLGSVNALAGSFIVALSAALTVYWMTRIGLPVSTTQAIVGAIIGWNLFSESITDTDTLFKILGTWVASPVQQADPNETGRGDHGKQIAGNELRYDGAKRNGQPSQDPEGPNGTQEYGQATL